MQGNKQLLNGKRRNTEILGFAHSDGFHWGVAKLTGAGKFPA
jgi:hypothetical protein